MDTIKWRQKLHLEPPQGWMNDPNGLCFFNGYYHFFFQYSPDSAIGAGDRGWGHCISQDLLEWRFAGYAIRPDIPEDKNGAYSGSALTWKDTLHIFYTGNVLEDGEHDYTHSGRGANVITITSADGFSFSEKQILLQNSDYPDFCCCHVRDPKVWRENGEFRMVLGARTIDDKGCVLFFSSDDLKSWQYTGSESIDDFGYMWECPDYFTLDDHRYLSVSPQGIPSEELRYQNIYQSGYFKSDNGLADFEEWDYGFDFYAPQTFETPDGRRIIVGWMGIGDIPYKNPTVELGWQHCLTLPREITRADDGSLLQSPIAELNSIRKHIQTLKSGESTDISLPCDIYAETENSFEIKLADAITLSFDENTCIFTFRFIDNTVGCGRKQRQCKIDECKNIRIIADISSLEIYLNNGRKVLSGRFYPASEKISFSVSGAKAEIFSLG